jgi:hypothetical protein
MAANQPTNHSLAHSLTHCQPAPHPTSAGIVQRVAWEGGGCCCFYFVLSWLSGCREPAGRQTETCRATRKTPAGGARDAGQHTQGKSSWTLCISRTWPVTSCHALFHVAVIHNPLRGKDLWTRRALPRRCLTEVRYVWPAYQESSSPPKVCLLAWSIPPKGAVTCCCGAGPVRGQNMSGNQSDWLTRAICVQDAGSRRAAAGCRSR